MAAIAKTKMLKQLIPENADWVIHEGFEIKQPLGCGAFATAYMASWKGSVVAAKKLHQIFFNSAVVPEQQRKEMWTEFVRECTLHAKLRHPNIVHLYGVYIPDDDGRERPVMLCELMAETLRSPTQREPRLTIRDVIDLCLQIACGLRFLHERDWPIDHRDLSASNVLLTETGVCKIADIGLAKVFIPAARAATTVKPGSEPYVPSEMLGAGAQYNEKLDVFSLGVLMLEMLLGHEPHPSPEWAMHRQVGDEVALFTIAEMQHRHDEHNELGANHPLRPLIERVLQPQASRPTIAEVYQELKRLESTVEYYHSPSTFCQAGIASLSEELDGLCCNLDRAAQSDNELWHQQTNTNAEQRLGVQQMASEQQLQAVTQQMKQAESQELVPTVTHQQTASQQLLQAVTQRRHKTITGQHLQQGRNQLEESVQGSLERCVSPGVTAQVAAKIENPTFSGKAMPFEYCEWPGTTSNQAWTVQPMAITSIAPVSRPVTEQPLLPFDEDQLRIKTAKHRPAASGIDVKGASLPNILPEKKCSSSQIVGTTLLPDYKSCSLPTRLKKLAISVSKDVLCPGLVDGSFLKAVCEASLAMEIEEITFEQGLVNIAGSNIHCLAVAILPKPKGEKPYSSKQLHELENKFASCMAQALEIDIEQIGVNLIQF